MITLPPKLDCEAFRRKLAGLSSPDRRGETDRAEIRDLAVRWVTILARLFGDDLDRKTLWDRIDSAIESACSKVADGDMDRWATLCLEHVKASPGKSAACDALTHMLTLWTEATAEQNIEFVAYCARHRYSLLVHGRAAWQDEKAAKAEVQE